MEKGHRYFIAYKHNQGYGNMEAILPGKIKSIKDIQEIQKYIFDDVKWKEGRK